MVTWEDLNPLFPYSTVAYGDTATVDPIAGKRRAVQEMIGKVKPDSQLLLGFSSKTYSTNDW